MLDHLKKTYEDSFFHMMDEEIDGNFRLNPFENVFNKNYVVHVQDNRYKSLDNKKFENTQNFFIDPWLFKQDIIDRQFEFVKTSMNNKTYEYENVQYESISKNHKEFESEDLEVVNEETSNISQDNC